MRAETITRTGIYTLADSPVLGLFTSEGEEVPASGNHPFLLDDDESVWLIESGKVEIFTVSVEAGEPVGARSHFVSVEEGQCFFGMDLDRYGMGSGFLVVGRMGTELRRLPVERLRQAAREESFRPGLAALVDSWVFALSRSLTRDIIPGPIVDVNLQNGDEVSLANEKKARSSRGVLWLDVTEGNLLFIGMEALYLEGRDLAFPLSPDTWLEASNDHGVETHLEAAKSQQALVSGGLWEGLEAFHEALCQCEFINKKLAVVDEFNRLKTKAQASDATTDAAYAELRSVLDSPDGGADDLTFDDDAEPFFQATQLVGRATGLAVLDHPEAQKKDHRADRLAAVAKASRFRTRVVALRGQWWKQDQGPILGEMASEDPESGQGTGAPVALLPTGPGSYICIDPKEETQQTVNEELAGRLAAFGTIFYRPLPEGRIGVFDLLRFGSRGLRGDLLMLAAMGIAVGLLGSLTPYVTGKIFDTAIPQAERGLLVQFATALIIASLTSAAFRITQSIAVLRIQGRMDYSIQSALWDRLLDLPSGFFRRFSAGDLADRADGISRIRSLLSGAGTAAILGSLSSVFYVFLMFFYSTRLALLAMGLTAVFVGFTTVANYMQLRLQRHQGELRGRISGLVLQLLSGVAKLRVSGAEDHAFRVWAREFAKQRRIEFRLGRIGNYVAVFNSAFPIFSSMAVFATLLGIQATAAGDSTLTTGQFIAFNAAYIAFLTATQSLSDASLNLLRIVPIYERLQPILTTIPEIDETKNYPGVLTGKIEISHVHFRYQEDGPWILQDVSLTIHPGEFVAFVGGSGSGKSTLMRLMLGFEVPQKGTIYYDGQDLSTLDLREVRQQLGVVLQDSRLMPTDVFTNIAGHVPSLTVEDAWEAAKQAGVAQDIQDMPMGMHTYVSGSGGGFSGGQKQRLLIARAIVRKPRLLYLDEATSALDNRAQAVVTESMERLQATRIVIAHRLSTILNADRICVLEGGTIREEGTYDQLLERDGLFAELARRQMA